MKTNLTKPFLLLVALFATVVSVNAQKITDKEIQYDFVQLPKTVIDKSIRNYQSTVILEYAKGILADQQKAQEEFDKAEADYPQVLAEAKAQYDERVAKYNKDLEEYNKKSTAKKLIEKQMLNENTKPVAPGPFYPPSRPVLRKVTGEKIFSADLLASTYLKLEGFTNAAENAVKITATLYGMVTEGGEVKTSQSTVLEKGTSRTVTNYWYEIKYKHPIGLKIELPDGQVLFNETLAELNEFVTYKTNSSTSQPYINKETLLATLQEKSVNENMKIIQTYLNSNYGFATVKRKIELYSVEPKKFEYPEYQTAFENASLGYSYLKANPTVAIEKLKVAITNWENGLKESDITNKKARIDEDITIKTYFNLIEAYIQTNNFMAAEEAVLKLNRLDLGKKEKKLSEQYSIFLKSQRERWDAHNPG